MPLLNGKVFILLSSLILAFVLFYTCDSTFLKRFDFEVCLREPKPKANYTPAPSAIPASFRKSWIRNKTSPKTSQKFNKLRNFRASYEAYTYYLNKTLDLLLSEAKTDDLDLFTMERSIANFGNVQRLETLIWRSLAEPKPLSLAVIGGSISRGPDSYTTTRNYKAFEYLGGPRYYHIVAHYLEELLQVPVKINNQFIGGTQSVIYSYCLRSCIDVLDTDIILMEFALNDEVQRIARSGIEELIRNVISIPFINRPFPIMTNFIIPQKLFMRKNPKCQSIEELLFNPIAKHYNVTAISWKRTVCNKTQAREEGYKEHDIGFHPYPKGHRQMGYLISYFILKVYNQLINSIAHAHKNTNTGKLMDTKDEITVATHADDNTIHEQLPNPIQEKVWMGGSACFFVSSISNFSSPCNDDKLLNICLDYIKGFEYKKNFRLKTGYHGTDTGSTLRFKCTFLNKTRAKFRVGISFRNPATGITELSVFTPSQSYLKQNISWGHFYRKFTVTNNKVLDEVVNMEANEFFVTLKLFPFVKVTPDLHVIALLFGFVE